MEWNAADVCNALTVGALTLGLLVFRENSMRADIIVVCVMAGAVMLSLARMVLA